MKYFSFDNSANLSIQIKKAIGSRLLFCFLLALFVIFFMSFNEINNSVSQIEKNTKRQCETLSHFTIGQVLIDNTQGIQPKLDALNVKPNTPKFTWHQGLTQKKHAFNQLDYSPPFSWVYVYPVQYNDGKIIGTFLVKGSFLNEKALLKEFFIKLGFLLGFCVILFFVLFPLGKKIPQKLFIEPINNLLLLLRNEKNYSFENMPEEITEISHKITNLLSEMEQRSRDVALGQLAARVAHDVRSPLGSMMAILKNISPQISNEKSQILESAIQSVRDIANNLLTQYKIKDENFVENSLPVDDANIARYILLSSIIDMLLSQKRYEWQDNPCDIHVEMSQQAKIAWIYASPNDVKRMLSNLLNNAYESLKDRRAIHLDCLIEGSALLLHIKDTGEGIAPDKMTLVLNGKSLKNGHGLGLSGAKTLMEKMAGELQLVSTEHQGTTVTLIFTIKTPVWFPKTISLPEKGPALFLDDDISMHKFWIDYAYPQRFTHFTTGEDLLSWIENHPDKKDDMMIFSDYELNEVMTGLDLLEKLNIGKNGYLITSYAETLKIQQRCERLGVYLIHKNILSDMLSS